MALFDKTIKFGGTFRPYQQRILDRLPLYVKDDKIHIVAAPGSGKTILGLQMILNFDQASLILTPTITIREQWVERFKNGFLLKKDDYKKYISTNINEYAPIICITYQALYSAFKKAKSEIEIDEDGNSEALGDYSNLNLFETLKNYNIKVVCLDECHHLKKEWRNTLEDTIKSIVNVKTISLTATPPYDSSPKDWQKYIELCGPIDEEIIVPELVYDLNLCPHQDYVYFNYPTEDEEKTLQKFYDNSEKVYQKYKNNFELLNIISHNAIYKNYAAFSTAYYKNPYYYRAFINYLVHNNIKVASLIKFRCHSQKKFFKEDFEILLQHVLFEDAKSYTQNDFLTSLKKELVALGLINKHKVNLISNDKFDRVLSGSINKLNSIVDIVKTELFALHSKMKMLILTDYIKKEAKSYINNNKEIDSLGTIPIFEKLRREDIAGIRLCVLSGSIVIIPTDCLDILNSSLPINYDEYVTNNLDDGFYSEVVINTTNRKSIVKLLTKMFENNYFNVVIGTKSLLGEGWDSPCVNSLILASFIGSYVLSNQTRGRAIRMDLANPNKVSNIWHLVCLDPFCVENSNDYKTLTRRFSAFLGIHLTKNSIEDGMGRLNLSAPPKNKQVVEKSNLLMKHHALNRDKVKEKWDKCINEVQRLDVVTKIVTFDKKLFKKSYSFFNAILQLFLTIVFQTFFFLAYFEAVNTYFDRIIALLILLLSCILSGSLIVKYILRIIRLATPRRKLHSLAETIVEALREIKVLKTKNIIVNSLKENNKVSCYLKNATTFEQNMFCECLKQMLSPISFPRYLICRPRNFLRREFYVVPDIFKKNKEIAKIFTNKMDENYGHHELIFTKNEDNKNIVFRAETIYFIRYNNAEITEKRILLKKKN